MTAKQQQQQQQECKKKKKKNLITKAVGWLTENHTAPMKTGDPLQEN